MNKWIALTAVAAAILLPTWMVIFWASEAGERLERAESVEPERIAVAAEANEAYCTGDLKQILRRVLTSCGLIGAAGGRGCQPLEAKNVATMDDSDFNALFVPMRERGAIVQFDKGSDELDQSDLPLIDKVFAERRGASYFLVVSRASPEGSVDVNRKISKGRAEAVLEHLKTTFDDPDLDQQVGLLWLGEEYAQLDPSFCSWSRSGEAEACSSDDLNRSAFVAWIDCQL